MTVRIIPRRPPPWRRFSALTAIESEIAVGVGSSSGGMAGLSFPGNAAVADTVDTRMRFRDVLNTGTWSRALNPWPFTAMWDLYPIEQPGWVTDDERHFWTTFFWGNDSDFQPTKATHGPHPYPGWTPGWDWEIATEGGDYIQEGGLGAVVWDRWYRQAFVARVEGSQIRMRFYWDLPNTDSDHYVERLTDVGWPTGMPDVPTLSWFGAPWSYGNEVPLGMYRRLRVWDDDLSESDILAEADEYGSSTGGPAAIWYAKDNPTPDDIADESGEGNDPEWASAFRPSLWEGEGLDG